nr:immunoglobulin light chain junction region [Macaca mulatta]MOV61486.1 immunoglobulin light chain junction region [Macaca mulatta]MOV63073.1 immunoglobulin light chain junction region [Macaca mulatta]MOV64679.1 immunoglobulin light chain junction region [Macaca mulatta]MOV64797.1 immunoglobulin light chain junction region [Macaca mulatta]
CQQYNNWNSF